MANIKIIFLWSGRYTVNVKYGDKHVPNSPFRVRAGPPFDASKVKVSGPGVDESPLTDEPVQFLCDCTEAGIAPLTGMRFLRDFIPIHTNVSMHILNTVPYTSSKVLTRRIF